MEEPKIRFRYYSPEYKEMCTVLAVDFVNDSFWILPYNELEGGDQIEVKGIDKLEQYIGLKDRDGVPIFEGDKMRLGLYRIFTVERDRNIWNIDPKDIPFLRVAGNIHEGIKE